MLHFVIISSGFCYSDIEPSLNKVLASSIYLQEGIVIVDTPGIGGGGKMSKYFETSLQILCFNNTFVWLPLLKY